MGLEDRLPPPVETALYRMVQESLTNIARHAQAETASVLLERRPDRVRAIIEDDGVGFDPAAAAKNGERLGPLRDARTGRTDQRPTDHRVHHRTRRDDLHRSCRYETAD
jgi:signal transduction histidine kinase